jgi:hypothetical protein
MHGLFQAPELARGEQREFFVPASVKDDLLSRVLDAIPEFGELLSRGAADGRHRSWGLSVVESLHV